MREIAHGFAAGRRPLGPALAALAAVTAIVALGVSSAMAATSPEVGIKTSFENSPISLNTSDAVGYALSNTTGASQNVTFTDSLPSGVVLDDPIGTTNTSGTGSCTLTPPNLNPGASSVTVSVTVPSPSTTTSSTVCTISFGVVPGTASANDAPLADTYGGVSATATATGKPSTTKTTTGSLIVLTNPTLSFTAPSNNRSFHLGQIADASFACTATDSLDSIDSFFGIDDEGNQIESGAPIDTVEPGSHTLEVDCYSAAGGGEVSQIVSYRVGSYTLAAVKEAKKTDYVSFRALVPAGSIVARVLDGKKTIGTTRLTVGARKTASVKIRPTAAGRKLLAAAKRKSVGVKLQVSFTPKAIGSGDAQITTAGATVVTKSIKLPIAQPAKKSAKKANKARAAGIRRR